MSSSQFPIPQGGASLVLSFCLKSKTIVIIGAGTLAASRVFAALEADSRVVVIATTKVCPEIQWRADQQEIELVRWEDLSAKSQEAAFEQYLSSQNDNITLVCITDTLLSLEADSRRTQASASNLYSTCRSNGIPVNVTDIPHLCDFTFASTHRFTNSASSSKSSLQIGVTTNGQGCRLAGRIRREIVAKLPNEVGQAVDRVGGLRNLAKSTDTSLSEYICDDDSATPNQPVPSRNPSEIETEPQRTIRRMKWVAQISEYWPFAKLASMTEEIMKDVLNGGKSSSPSTEIINTSLPPSQHSLILPYPATGKILLLGSGPGHPSLLTIATHKALTEYADLVLSDKLVPAAVLALIPSHVQVRIARKFPGNADGAQTEMMEAAVEAAQKGLCVVRLKQGDPSVYGRFGEEMLYFRRHKIEALVIPGVSSALAGPTFAGIPVTQRGVADSFVVCTGVGREGRDVSMPGYERSRTVVLLMGVARLGKVISSLIGTTDSDAKRARSGNGKAYPPYLPIALIERASMPDQRILVSTLKDIERALESLGEQRPPGMLVIGWSVLALWAEGDVTVLDDENVSVEEDTKRVEKWLGTDAKVGWRSWEGLNSAWEGL